MRRQREMGWLALETGWVTAMRMATEGELLTSPRMDWVMAMETGSVMGTGTGWVMVTEMDWVMAMETGGAMGMGWVMVTAAGAGAVTAMVVPAARSQATGLPGEIRRDA